MTNPLVLKLNRWRSLAEADTAALDRICAAEHPVPRGHHLTREGDRPDAVFVLLEGWAARYKITNAGKRQIVGLLVPGDLCDAHVFILAEMDHGIVMLSAGRVARIASTEMLRSTDEHPAITKALWWATLVDEAVLREWLLNLGARDAYARLAHLCCELSARMDNVGLLGADAARCR